METKQVFYIAYIFIAAMIFVALITFSFKAISNEGLYSEYLSREVALLEDTIISSKGDIYVYYKLNENLEGNFDFVFDEDCSVGVSYEDLEGQDIFYCSLMKSIDPLKGQIQKTQELKIIKDGDKLELEK